MGFSTLLPLIFEIDKAGRYLVRVRTLHIPITLYKRILYYIKVPPAWGWLADKNKKEKIKERKSIGTQYTAFGQSYAIITRLGSMNDDVLRRGAYLRQ